MKKLLVFLFYLFITQLLCAQHSESWNQYYGNSKEETKQKLLQYLSHYQYKGAFSQTDSTLALVVNDSTATWTIYSTFYFDEQGQCYAYANKRCDSFRHINRANFLANKDLKPKKIGTNQYITRFSKSELIQITEDEECTVVLRKKLSLTRKDYKALLSEK